MIRELIVVSDSLEDDTTFHCVSVGLLANPAHANELAARLRAQRAFMLQGVAPWANGISYNGE